MDIVASSPMPCAVFVFQPAPGVYALAVVQKITLLLTPEVCSLAPEQEPIHEEEVHWDDDPRRSLQAPCDVAPFKRRVDVLLVGSAYAPGGRPVKSLTARLTVGPLEKGIEVYGPRLFTQTGELRDGAAFAKMPLRYERAAGGPDTWNPAGVWLDGPRDPYGQKHLPYFQPEGVELREVGQFVPPIGFGPIASRWPLRAERLRGRDDIKGPRSARDVPLGDDFDADYFQDAPPDQQMDSLAPDAAIVLSHLHPERERFATKLPGLSPRARLSLSNEEPVDVPLVADTLWIDTDRGLCTVTFRGHVALADPAAKGRVQIALVDVDGLDVAPVDSASVRTLEIRAAGGKSTPLVLQSAPKVATETTAVQPPSPATAALPFVRDSAVKPIVAPPKPQSMPMTRRNTEEVVLPPGGLAGPSWFAHGEKAPTPSTPPVTPVLKAPPAPPPPPPPPLVGSPAVAPPPAPSAVQVSLGDLSNTALSATGPVLRAQGPAPEVLKLGAIDEKALRSAASGGLLAASNAAAGPAKKEPVKPAAAEEPSLENKADGGYLELLSLDRAVAPRLRTHKVFSAWMRPPPKAPPVQQGKPPPPPPTPEAIEKAERADVLHVLSKDPSAAAEALSLDEDGDPPLVLVAGTLSFPFDEIEALKATIACAKPLAASDRKLKEALDLAAELLRSELETTDAAEALTMRIRDAWGRAPKPKEALPIEHRVEQKLLEERKYQRRGVLDADHLRALLSPSSGQGEVVVYLPVKLEKRLPLFARFQVKMLAELYPSQDPSERSASALRALCLARVTPRPRLSSK